MAKKKTNSKYNWTGISILIILLAIMGVLIYGGLHDWFNFNINIEGDVTNIDAPSGNDLNVDLDNKEPDPLCVLSFDKASACQGEEVTGTVKDGIQTHCYLFADAGAGWTPVLDGDTDIEGEWTESRSTDALGTYHFRALCDKDDDGKYTSDIDCITNEEIVKIKDCTPDPDYDAGDNVGGIDGDNNMGSGINEVVTPIDLGDLPPFEDEGEFGLRATIQTSWDYNTPEECMDIQSGEGMIFSLYDSLGLAWTRTDVQPVALGDDTGCVLQWDGINEWYFKAEKIKHDFDCQIYYEYDVDVYICER